MNKILVVEDEVALFGALEDKLRSEGFVVVGANNGEEGLKKAVSELPDLILLDIVMPVMDGMTMLKKLRQGGDKTPVIILTNLGDAEQMSDAVENDTTGYLIKTDWSMEDIVTKIKEKLKI